MSCGSRGTRPYRRETRRPGSRPDAAGSPAASRARWPPPPRRSAHVRGPAPSRRPAGRTVPDLPDPGGRLGNRPGPRRRRGAGCGAGGCGQTGWSTVAASWRAEASRAESARDSLAPTRVSTAPRPSKPERSAYTASPLPDVVGARDGEHHDLESTFPLRIARTRPARQRRSRAVVPGEGAVDDRWKPC